MTPHVIDPDIDQSLLDAVGAVLCENVRAGDRRLRKGDRLATEDVQDLQLLESPVVSVLLDPDEVHEDEAGVQIATAVAGPGVEIADPSLSRVNLLANVKGLLRIDRNVVDAINRIGEVGVFTLTDRLAVVPGTNVGAVKVTPVAIQRAILDQSVEIANRTEVVSIEPFRPLQIGIVSTEGMNPKAQAVFQKSIRSKIEWFGGDVLGFSDTADDAQAVADAICQFLDQGADLIMTGGGNTINPLDAAINALDIIGARMIRSGVPAHPGSMFWLAYRDEIPIFNLASCSMYSQSTTADLVLSWIMAGEHVTPDDLSELGYGGLLDKGMEFRFPPYES